MKVSNSIHPIYRKKEFKVYSVSVIIDSLVLVEPQQLEINSVQ